MKTVIAYHGHCFDGFASAALLGRFLAAAHLPQRTEMIYRGLEHRPGGSCVQPEILDGDVNAIVDFRYTTSPSLHWYFDHHPTGVVGAEELAHLREDESGQRFFDPDYGSCCRLIFDALAEHHSFRAEGMDDLVAWADVIDAAQFSSAETATDLRDPVMQFVAVLEVHGDTRFVAPRIAALVAGRSLAATVDTSEIRKLLRPIARLHAEAAEVIVERARDERGVICFDLTDRESLRYHKFAPYALFPDSVYYVATSATARRIKISVGRNPWVTSGPRHHVGELCLQHGGGGHRDVGAVALPRDAIADARRIAAEVADVLRQGELA